MTFITKIKNSEFVRSVTTLLSGNVIAQIITFAVIPIISRIFSPEHFGIFALYASIIAIFGKIGSLCYERAILLPDNKEDAICMAIISFICLSVIQLIVVFFIMFWSNTIAEKLGNPKFQDWLFLIPIGAIVVCSTNIISYWLLRQNKLKTISISYMATAICSAALKILLGIIVASWAGGLILGAFFGSLISLIIMVLAIKDLFNLELRKDIKLKRLVLLAAKYKQFPLFASLNAFLNVMSAQVVIFFVAALYTPAIVGFYSLSVSMLTQPSTTVGNAISKIYFRKASIQNNERNNLLPGLIKTCLGLIILAIVPFSIVGIWGQQIFMIVFGDEWIDAGRYAQIMIPWFFVMFVQMPLTTVFEVCQKQNIKLVINVITSIAIGITLYFSYLNRLSIIEMLMYITYLNVILGILQIVASFVIARQNDLRLTIKAS